MQRTRTRTSNTSTFLANENKSRAERRLKLDKEIKDIYILIAAEGIKQRSFEKKIKDLELESEEEEEEEEEASFREYQVAFRKKNTCIKTIQASRDKIKKIQASRAKLSVLLKGGYSRKIHRRS